MNEQTDMKEWTNGQIDKQKNRQAYEQTNIMQGHLQRWCPPKNIDKLKLFQWVNDLVNN